MNAVKNGKRDTVSKRGKRGGTGTQRCEKIQKGGAKEEGKSEKDAQKYRYKQRMEAGRRRETKGEEGQSTLLHDNVALTLMVHHPSVPPSALLLC